VLATAQGSGIPAAVAQLAAFFVAARMAIRRGLARDGDPRNLVWLGIGTAVISGFLASMFITAEFTTTWLTWLFIGAVVANRKVATPAASRGRDLE
jgi:drug/metabolite transporter (DMT)-like permease